MRVEEMINLKFRGNVYAVDELLYRYFHKKGFKSGKVYNIDTNETFEIEELQYINEDMTNAIK